ncbi:MAG: hypothetical protein AAGA09_03180 [Pseudomonadota bacterium]
MPENPNRKIRPCKVCTGCVCFNLCERATLPDITNEMLRDRVWLRNARNFASTLCIEAGQWPHEIFNFLQDLRVAPPKEFCVLKLFQSPENGDDAEILNFLEALRTWCRDFLCMDKIPEGARVFVTDDRREHARAVFRLLGSHYPDEFEKWGRR